MTSSILSSKMSETLTRSSACQKGGSKRIRLLNRAVPIIALQLNAFTFSDPIVLHFTKVLDVYESIEDIEEIEVEQADRRSSTNQH